MYLSAHLWRVNYLRCVQGWVEKLKKSQSLEVEGKETHVTLFRDPALSQITETPHITLGTCSPVPSLDCGQPEVAMVA